MKSFRVRPSRYAVGAALVLGIGVVGAGALVALATAGRAAHRSGEVRLFSAPDGRGYLLEDLSERQIPLPGDGGAERLKGNLSQIKSIDNDTDHDVIIYADRGDGHRLVDAFVVPGGARLNAPPEWADLAISPSGRPAHDRGRISSSLAFDRRFRSDGAPARWDR